MRKPILATALILGLTACQTQAPPSPVVTTVVSVLPENVQALAVKSCGYLPALETVLGLLQAFGKGSDTQATALAIATEVCNAVTARSSRGAVVLSVRGVPLRGHFVR